MEWYGDIIIVRMESKEYSITNVLKEYLVHICTILGATNGYTINHRLSCYTASGKKHTI